MVCCSLESSMAKGMHRWIGKKKCVLSTWKGYCARHHVRSLHCGLDRDCCCPTDYYLAGCIDVRTTTRPFRLERVDTSSPFTPLLQHMQNRRRISHFSSWRFITNRRRDITVNYTTVGKRHPCTFARKQCNRQWHVPCYAAGNTCTITAI